MKRGRKRSVIIERISSSSSPSRPSIITPDNQLHLFPWQRTNLYMKNGFFVELENDHTGVIIDSTRVQGFKVIDNVNKGKTLIINAVLNIGEWLEDFEKMTIAKIFLLDNSGEPSKVFDYDIEILEHTFNGDYKADEILIPSITYKIID